MAQIIILPVVHYARDYAPPVVDTLPADVTDINAFRYRKQRASQDRVDLSSYLTSDGEWGNL